jgi:hypothetical protein
LGTDWAYNSMREIEVFHICKDSGSKTSFLWCVIWICEKDEMVVLVICWACKCKNQSNDVWGKYQEPRCVVQHGPLFNLITRFCVLQSLKFLLDFHRLFVDFTVVLCTYVLSFASYVVDRHMTKLVWIDFFNYSL